MSSDFKVALPCAMRVKKQVCTHLSNLVCVCCPFMSPFVPMCEPGGELQTSSGTLDEGLDEDAEWEDERDMERAACEGEDFIPPKIMVRILTTNFEIENTSRMYEARFQPRALQFICTFPVFTAHLLQGPEG